MYVTKLIIYQEAPIRQLVVNDAAWTVQAEPVFGLEIDGVGGGSGERILERKALLCEAF
jgi:hypothetical protein